MRVLIVHFRSAPPTAARGQCANVDPQDSAGTDGVSLEMVKRRALLEEMGHEVAVCSAYNWAEFPVPALEFDSEGVTSVVRDLFGANMDDCAGESELKAGFDSARAELKRQLGDALKDFAPQLIFVHNILSLPVHPAATVSLAELLRETELPCAAVHHDILSEGAYKFTPSCDLANSILEQYYPPMMPNLRHWTINTRNRRALAKRDVDAEVIHDTMDFDHRLSTDEREDIRTCLRAKHDIESHDVVLFAAARIVPNKQTELAGHLAAALQGLRGDMTGKTMYNGEVFSSKSRIVLVLAGRPERAFTDYQRSLYELFDSLQITWRYIGDDLRPCRLEDEGLYALYPDSYAMADFVLYPSGWEGFGNQLLEAFAAGLPAAVFEYPVFKEDIAPKGVKVVSIGDTLLPERDDRGLVQIPHETLTRAAGEMAAILTSREQVRDIADNNIGVGRKHFSFDVLRRHLQDMLDWAGSR